MKIGLLVRERWVLGSGWSGISILPHDSVPGTLWPCWFLLLVSGWLRACGGAEPAGSGSLLAASLRAGGCRPQAP